MVTSHNDNHEPRRDALSLNGSSFRTSISLHDMTRHIHNGKMVHDLFYDMKIFETVCENTLVQLFQKCHTSFDNELVNTWIQYTINNSYSRLFVLLLATCHDKIDSGFLLSLFGTHNVTDTTIRQHFYFFVFTRLLKDMFDKDDIKTFQTFSRHTLDILRQYHDIYGRVLIDLVCHFGCRQIFVDMISKGLINHFPKEKQAVFPDMYDLFCDVHTRDMDIFVMIEENNIDMVRHWVSIDTSQVNTRNDMGVTPLYEAVRLGRDEIIDILRDHGALLCSQHDIDQVCVQNISRRHYFHRLASLVHEIVPTYPTREADVVVFFHTVHHSDNLFCCSVRFQRDPKNTDTCDFVTRLSRYILPREITQFTHILSPLCQEFQMRFTQEPIRIHDDQHTFGYICVFSSLTSCHNNDSPINLNMNINMNGHDTTVERDMNHIFFQRFDMISSEHHTLWKDCLLTSSIFREWIERCILYLRSEESCIFYTPLSLLIQLWPLLRSSSWAHVCRSLFNTHAKCSIPFTPVGKDVMTLLSSVVVGDIPNETQESFVFSDMLTKTYTYTTFTGRHEHRKKALTSLDLFDCVGNEERYRRVKNHLDEINAMIYSMSHESLLTDFRTILTKVRSWLGFSSRDETLVYRQKAVVGLSSYGNDHYRIFVPYHEIPDAMETVFHTRSYTSFNDIVTLYTLCVKWIHPFDDGNGRTFRVLCTILLRQMGYVYTLTKDMNSLIQEDEILLP